MVDSTAGDGLSSRLVVDPRRWAALQCSGIYLLLMTIQAYYEDLLGALEADQLELARYSARATVLACLQVHAVGREGTLDDEGDALTDPCAGVPSQRVVEALAAARGVVTAPTVEAARTAVGPIEEQIADVVRLLGFEVSPPSIRTPAGLFPALRVARELLPVNREAHLPLVFPQSWLSGGR